MSVGDNGGMAQLLYAMFGSGMAMGQWKYFRTPIPRVHIALYAHCSIPTLPQTLIALYDH